MSSWTMYVCRTFCCCCCCATLCHKGQHAALLKGKVFYFLACIISSIFVLMSHGSPATIHPTHSHTFMGAQLNFLHFLFPFSISLSTNEHCVLKEWYIHTANKKGSSSSKMKAHTPPVLRRAVSVGCRAAAHATWSCAQVQQWQCSFSSATLANLRS